MGESHDKVLHFIPPPLKMWIDKIKQCLLHLATLTHVTPRIPQLSEAKFEKRWDKAIDNIVPDYDPLRPDGIQLATEKRLSIFQDINGYMTRPH